MFAGLFPYTHKYVFHVHIKLILCLKKLLWLAEIHWVNVLRLIGIMSLMLTEVASALPKLLR